MKLLWPLNGHYENSISQGFNGTSLNYAPMVGHNGLDFPASEGTPIRAVYDGYIIERLTRPTGFGKRITQKFFADGRWWQVVYGHQLKFVDPTEFEWNWNKNDVPVKQGAVIGYVDSTGFSTGDHLHFGLYPMNADGTNYLINNGYGGGTDPLPYLKGDTMVYFAHLEGTKEYGFVEETPFTKVYTRGVNEPDIKFNAAKFGLNVTRPDGSIDFSRAKDIRI